MARTTRWLALALGLLLAGCGEEVLYDDLMQREANQLITALRQSGIGARRTGLGEGVFSVVVAPGDFTEAIRLLEQRGLPRRRFQRVGDVFAADGLMSTPLEERTRLAFALSEELARSLSAIDGVLDAHVHLTLPEDRPLAEKDLPAKASVLLTHAPDFAIDGILPDVKFLVAKGVPELSYRNVSVVAIAEKQWQVPQKPTAHYASFLGIRFVEGDARKFHRMLTSLGIAVAIVVGVVIFVFWRFGFLGAIRRDIESIDIRALTDPARRRAGGRPAAQEKAADSATTPPPVAQPAGDEAVS